MFGVIMPLCNRMFCCIFGWYIFIKTRFKYEKIILLSYGKQCCLSALEHFHCLPLWKTVRLHEKSYRMQQIENSSPIRGLLSILLNKLPCVEVDEGIDEVVTSGILSYSYSINSSKSVFEMYSSVWLLHTSSVQIISPKSQEHLLQDSESGISSKSW